MKGVFSSCLLISAVLLLTLFSQSSFAQESVQRVTSSSALAFSKGADVGWLSQMEATGYKFYDSDGTQKDC
jgi:arabinogalactan endo-1,4-beta-galactosidase